MSLYIEVISAEKEVIGKLYLEKKKIRIETPTEGGKDGFKEDIKLWKKNCKHLGVVDDESLFYKIPYITSHYSREIFSKVKGNPDQEQIERIAEEEKLWKK